MRTFFLWLILLVGAGAILFMIGPKEKVDLNVTFDANRLGNDIDAYLANAEAGIDDIIPGAQKQMVWADPDTKAKQAYSIVYLHGFSATLEEIRPVPDMIAKQLNANLFYTRLAGHGRTGDAMAEPSVNDWMQDVAEAFAIGRATGEKVIVISTSTGGTLAALAVERPSLMKQVHALINFSPNFAVQSPQAWLLTLPWARQIIPKLAGETREWEPKNELQRQWWTTKYPMVATIPLQAAVEAAEKVNFEEMTVPALFVFHPDDGVVKSDVTQKVAVRWGKNTGAKSEVFEITTSTDTSNHVIAGDILSPSNNEPVVAKSLAWLNSL